MERRGISTGVLFYTSYLGVANAVAAAAAAADLGAVLLFFPFIIIFFVVAVRRPPAPEIVSGPSTMSEYNVL